MQLPPQQNLPDSDEPSALDRIYRRKPLHRRISQRLGLQTKLLITFILIIAVTLASFCFLWLHDGKDRLVDVLGNDAEQIVTILAATAADDIQNGALDDLHAVSKELVRGGQNVLYVVFYAANGHPILSEAQGSVSYRPEPLHVERVSGMGNAEEQTDARFGQHIACVQPVFRGGAIVGFVKIGVGMYEIAHQTQAMKLTASKVGGACLLLAIPVAWLVVKRIFLPIRLLVVASRRIASGDIDTRVETDRPDVIGDLARAFNDMTRTVKLQQEALHQANHKLAEANRDLETKVEQRTTQYEIANKRLSAEIAEKEDFLRAVSHDLNAPLRNISGMVTMLLMKKKDVLDDDMKHRLDRIKKNVEIETDLINELLELSRIKTRRQAMETVDIEAMVWDLRGMFENDLKTRGIELILDTQLPPLYCERARIRQVLQNLIDNAIKYMGDGEPREIHVGCQIRLSEAEFYVRDTGVGIDADDISKVFFVFRRGKNTAARNVAGKGVGLASVKSIVETYSGKIWVESELGKGTTFRFTINGQYVPATGGGSQRQGANARSAAA